MAKEKFSFQAEVSKLLDIVARSLYSHKEVFLRELISNASDACDRLRYLALTEPKLTEGDPAFKIALTPDKKTRTLTVSDNGIGMDRTELTENLGTIARSGTQAFLTQMSGDKAKDVNLVGQFGVGFYSAFMVADKVEVRTRKAGSDKAWLWTSDGKGEYTIEEAERPSRGTDVILHLSKDDEEFAEPLRLKVIVTQYSDHIGIPIVVKEDGKEETANAASALWTRPAKDITADQHREFYHHVAHAADDPWLIMHNRVEGVLSYTNLLFVPSARPFDIFHPERRHRVKLYVKRVFITDNCEGLLPGYLRFVKGVVDSEDLNLNVSREMLQRDPKLAKIRAGLVKRILGELKKKAESDPDGYAKFWDAFGAVLKEGLYEDFENRDRLLEITRFRSTRGDVRVSLDSYIKDMKKGQDAIFYISGEDPAQLALSPQLEGFKAKGIEVLILIDPVDEFWLPALGAYKDKPFQSVTRGGVDMDKIEGQVKEEAKPAETEKDKSDVDLDPLIKAFTSALGMGVKKVRASARLTDSAVCLVADDGDLDIHFERMLKAHRQLGAQEAAPRILEVNPRHALIRKLAEVAKTVAGKDGILDDAAHLLFEQARIVEGEPVTDPQAFARRLAAMLERGLTV